MTHDKEGEKVAGESTLGTNSDDLFRTFSSKELHFERPEYTWYYRLTVTISFAEFLFSDLRGIAL